MAASLLPRIVVAPVAGVIVDRFDRRRLMIAMDVIRGIAVLMVAAAAIVGALQVWMVFAAGILIGLCGAFFTPSVNSVIPDITAREKVMQANSVFSMIQTGGNIVGNSAGGFLFQLIGAPFLFLFNGLSYLFSAGSLLFTRVPRVVHEQKEMRFGADLKSGLSFVWKLRGLRYLLLIAALLNFFAGMAMMLILPFYQRDPSLGPARYGIAIATLTGGMFLGMALTAVVKFPAAQRHTWFIACGGVSMSCLVVFPFARSFSVALTLLGLAGLGNGILNVFIMTVIQLAVPQTMRGKVFSLMGMIMQGLTPVAFALGGVLAEFLPIGLLISGGFTAALLFGIPMMVVPSLRRFLNFDPEKDTVESVA